MFLLNMSTREIVNIDHVPSGEWVRAKFHVKRLINDHHDIEWEDVTIQGMISIEDGCLLLQDRDSAFDIEYYTRGDSVLQWES